MKVLAFGIAKDIIRNSAIELELPAGVSLTELKRLLEDTYPRLNQLGSYMIAVNNEYVSNNCIIHSNDEVAIIPPVSGG